MTNVSTLKSVVFAATLVAFAAPVQSQVDYSDEKVRNPQGSKEVKEGWERQQKEYKERKERKERDVPLDEVKKSHQERGARNVLPDK